MVLFWHMPAPPLAGTKAQNGAHLIAGFPSMSNACRASVFGGALLVTYSGRVRGVPQAFGAVSASLRLQEATKGKGKPPRTRTRVVHWYSRVTPPLSGLTLTAGHRATTDRLS
jgi:hypothetical protein